MKETPAASSQKDIQADPGGRPEPLRRRASRSSTPLLVRTIGAGSVSAPKKTPYTPTKGGTAKRGAGSLRTISSDGPAKQSKSNQTRTRGQTNTATLATTNYARRPPAPARPALAPDLARAVLEVRQKRRQKSARQELGRRHLIDFAQYVDPTFITAPHLEYIAGKLERLQRREIKRLMIFAPPRHGKSKLVSELFPAWALGRDRAEQFMICSNAATLCDTFSRNVRNMIQSAPYRELFPATVLSDDSAAIQMWTLEGFTRPAMISASVGSIPVGQGAKILDIDDPIGSMQEGESAKARESVYQWYTGTIRPRLEPDAAIILNMQRWHDDDLAGRLIADMARAEQWEVLFLPAFAEDNDALGRPPGAPLWPARWPEHELRAIESVSARSFAAKYQQRPRPAEGSLFKKVWLTQRIDAAPPGLRWLRYYDLAYSTKQTADNSASIACAIDALGNVYFRRGWASKMESPDVRRKIKETMMSERDTGHGVELAVQGGSVIQDLQRDKDLIGFSFRGVKVDTDKMVRAVPLADRAEAGQVFFVRESVSDDAWITDWVDELAAFPYGVHDDRVDAASGSFLMHATGSGWAAYAQQQLDKHEQQKQQAN